MNLDTSDFIDYDYYLNDIKSKGRFYSYVVNTVGRNMNNYTWPQFYQDVIYYPADKVFIEKIIRRKAQHEMGHALGLLHEQSFPGGIQWNKDTIYKYYARMHWTKEMVDFNVLTVADQFYTNGTTYDPKSIMHYPVYSWQTLNGFSVDESTVISDGDKKLIAALYPKDKQVSDLEVPRVIISNFTKLNVKDDKTRQAFSIQPAFDLRTGALTASAYFVARLVTEDGQYYIPTDKQVYSWNGNAATYLKANLPGNSAVSYNKGTNKMELLFPYNQMPADLQGKKFKVEFAVYQNNASTGKMDRLVMYSTSSLLSMGTSSK
jgi:Astacin (Peptidase family M12A)